MSMSSIETRDFKIQFNFFISIVATNCSNSVTNISNSRYCKEFLVKIRIGHYMD